MYTVKEQKWAKVFLMIVLWFWMVQGWQQQLTSIRVLNIVNEAHASTVSALDPVTKPDSSTLSEEYRGETAKSSPEVRDLIARTFPEDKETALKVAQGESGLNPMTASNCDVTKDGYAYSWGLFQINLTQHVIQGVDCTKAFKGRNNSAIVIDYKLYQKCVKMAQDAEINASKARQIYDSRGWSGWGFYNKVLAN